MNIISLKNAAAQAADRKAAAQAAAQEAKARRERAEALKAEAEEIRQGLTELASVEGFLDQAGKAAAEEARQRLAEIEADEGYQALKAEIEAKEAAEARRLLEADLARRDRAEKARAEARKKARAQEKTSQDVFKWVRATGPARLACVVEWAGRGLAKAAVRLERDENGGRPVIRVSSVRGETRNFRIGQAWPAAWSSLPTPLRKKLAKAGWVEAPASAKK